MRLKLILSGVMLPPALLLAGCAMNTSSSLSANQASPAVSGRSFGGQNPIVGATIEVVAMGTSGYGSAGTVLASTTTDGQGAFSFASGAYACPQPDTPVYLLGIGGDSGAGVNPNAVTAAGLGTCTAAKNSYVVMNEVTTAAIAYALSHFFTTSLGGSNASGDWFGGPSVNAGGGTLQYSTGLVEGNSYTIPAMVSNAVGAPNQPTPTWSTDTAKINSIANSLAACINSSGALSTTETKTPCGMLFHYTTPPGASTRPSDTLQAAVQMALYPYQNVAAIYNLAPAQDPFIGLTAAPNDWTVTVSYTSPNLGLAVDTGAVSTLDIDRQGRVWFPSNKSGAVGAAYFDPASRSFNGPFNTTGLVHPEQVALDGNGYAWYSDSGSTSISGYLSSNPGSTHTLSLPNTYSNSVTVGDDNRVDVGTTNGKTYGMAKISIDYTTYSPVSGVSFAYPVVSMAGDSVGGDAVTGDTEPSSKMTAYYVYPSNAVTSVLSANDNSGQVIFTGNDFIAVRSYSGSGNNPDALCIYSQQTCFDFNGTVKNTLLGIAIDGASNLWIAESGNSAVLNVPIFNANAGNGTAYVNSKTGIEYHEYLHGSGYGSTMTNPSGIGIDPEGNVWVSNAGCIATGCVPGSFTLTEVVGAAAPTVTPVSGQITGNDMLVGTEPTY